MDLWLPKIQNHQLENKEIYFTFQMQYIVTKKKSNDIEYKFFLIC